MKPKPIAAVVLVAGTLTAAVVLPASAEDLARAKAPEEVGLSSERLERLSAGFKAGVDKGEIPGAVVLIARNGKIAYFSAFGFRDREAGAPMTTDAIFRIASMTKPVTSLAVMMLAEQGALQIAHPASRYLPEFKDLQVGVEKKGADGKTELALEPPRREMTVHDLLRHTSGFAHGLFGRSMVKDLYDRAAVNDPQTNAELVSKLAKLPLQFQPGSIWEYSIATEVLGRVVEVVSGMSLDAFIAERIAKPLKLADTGFWVDPSGHARIAEAQVDKATGQRPPLRDVKSRPGWTAGGSGLVSTALDYARFCQLLLSGGELDGVRLISRKTIDLMTADHLPPGMPMGPTVSRQFGILLPSADMGQGFGLGFLVRTSAGRNPMPGSVGEYSWAGLDGTYFWIDPQENMLAVMMTQDRVYRWNYRYLVRDLVYQALADQPWSGKGGRT
ncbi:MAG TPA: serine hydrolase domain-containing protein [Mesorhizobium sp.]|nr:serine hydrolase domain-containing protein [Mesorhizobium sp.]